MTQTEIHLHHTTTLTPEQYVAGLTDFGPGRSKLFGNSADEYLKVHDGPEHEAEQPSLEVLAFAYNDHVNVGRAVGLTCEGIGVARLASPHVGVGRREDDAVRIGPVVVQAFPNAARAFRDVALRGAPVTGFFSCRYGLSLRLRKLGRRYRKTIRLSACCSSACSRALKRESSGATPSPSAP
jgi:hypothetical protein